MKNTSLKKSPILDVNSLKVNFQTKTGKVTGVKDLSFSIFPGETVCLVEGIWIWKVSFFTFNYEIS